MATILFGFGPASVSCGGITADFPDSTGDIEFVKLSQNWVTSDNMARSRITGYQPTIRLHVLSFDAITAGELKKLVAVINESNATGQDIVIRPRIDPGSGVSLEYSCKLISDFKPQDIANFPVGQTLDLIFQATQKESSIPSLFSGSQIYNLTDIDGTDLTDIDDEQLTVIA